MKILSHADSVAILCVDIESVIEVTELAETLCKAARAQLNREKCLGFWHVEWDVKPLQYGGIPRSSTPGVYL